MIRLRYDFESISIDIGSYSSALELSVERLIRRAAFAFLRAAAPRVRVRTGFAHGSLRNLARALGEELPAGTPGTTPRAKEFYYFGGGAKILKTPFTSAPFATSATAVFLRQSGKITFQYNIDIAYYPVRDITSWRSFAAGENAFARTIAREFPKIVPDIEDYVITRSN